MTVDSDKDVAGLMAAGHAVRRAFEKMQRAAKPGVSTAELDAIGAQALDAAGAESAPQRFYEFPGVTCISVNEEAAHGIPGSRVLRLGDMVNIDVSAVLDGYVADMGESFVIGPARPEQAKIIQSVRAAVRAALARVRAGRSLNVIGEAVQKVADGAGFNIISNLGSHGVGRSIHEQPSYVPLDNPTERRRLENGMVMTIEPFFTTGPAWVEQQSDGWTLCVPKGELVAQYEQTLIVTDRTPVLVTA